MKIEIIRETRLSGSYVRDNNVCWWHVYHDQFFGRYVAYTDGDRQSECDICSNRYHSDTPKKYFSTLPSALAYLSGIVGA